MWPTRVKPVSAAADRISRKKIDWSFSSEGTYVTMIVDQRNRRLERSIVEDMSLEGEVVVLEVECRTWHPKWVIIAYYTSNARNSRGKLGDVDKRITRRHP